MFRGFWDKETEVPSVMQEILKHTFGKLNQQEEAFRELRMLMNRNAFAQR